MKQLLLSIVLLLINFSVYSQTLKGIVLNGETYKPMGAVTVQDMANGHTTGTDSEGNFMLNASIGDMISFSFNGYHPIQKTATSYAGMGVSLLPISMRLPEYTVHELTQFQKDSVEMTNLYSQELNRKTIKPKVSTDGGLVVSGLIGAPVQRMSKSYKRNKKFKETFKKDMEQKFIDSRYKPDLVTTLTGLTGDSLLRFMNKYPMEYAYARSVSDLELKAWIRDNYKEYSKDMAVGQK